MQGRSNEAQAPAREDEERLDEIFPHSDATAVTNSTPTAPRDDRDQPWLGSS
jgi:hypothetical protein